MSRNPVEPIYEAADAVACLERFRPAPYATWFDVSPDIRARFWNAGHLLGSASVEVEVLDADGTGPLRLLFSADVGPNFKLLHPDPDSPHDLDYVICEGTYGDTDRDDATAKGRRTVLRDEVRAAQNRNGALLIPSFAVERAQELITRKAAAKLSLWLTASLLIGAFCASLAATEGGYVRDNWNPDRTGR